MEGNSLILLYFKWWYTEGYGRLFRYLKAVYIYLTDLFSVKISLKTLFAPWKRDVISYEGLTLQQRFSVWTLNLASRFIGFLVKIFTLLTYIISIAVLSTASLTLIVTWLFIPILSVYSIYFGIKLFLSN